MDPNTALLMMREAQQEGRWEDADAHAADLGAWLDRGGFQPRGLTSREAAYAFRALTEERAAA